MEMLRVLFEETVKWGDLVQPILETVLTVLLPIVLSLLGLWLKRLESKVKAELSSEQLAFVSMLARQFVLAAEQSGLTGKIEDIGSAKKKWVLNLLEAEALKSGIKLNASALSAIIEAAVVDEFGLSEKSEKPVG